MESIIRKTYYNPEEGLSSAKKLFEKLKTQGVTVNQIKDFLSKQEVAQQYKPVNKPKHYFPIMAKYENEIMQLDLVDMSNISTTNSGYKWLLCGIDIFTRKAYCEPIKNKTAETVTNAFENILKTVKPKIINCDNGSEFTSNTFKHTAKNNDIIIRYVPVDEHHKLGVIDRFVRTLRNLINKYCSMYETTKYIDVLQKLVNNYNMSYHSGIKGIPNKVNKDKLEEQNTNKYNQAKENESIFKIGDQVRHILNRKMFEKGSNPHWSKTVHKIVDKLIHSYTLDNNKSYKYYELMFVSDSQKPNIIKTRTKTNEPTKEQLRKTNSIKRKLTKEGIDTSNIIIEKRERKPTDRFKF